MSNQPVVLTSVSGAMDGAFTAIADVSAALRQSSGRSQHRLIGGLAVILHVQRLGLDLPMRATGDADFGVPPYVLQEPELVDTIEDLGYHKVAGNRWERALENRRTASVDLLIPSYRTRVRDTARIGTVTTTEVPGLAEALQGPGIPIEAELYLTDDSRLTATTLLPDALGMLTLKVLARTVRAETRDVGDIWRCLEIAAADNVQPDSFDDTPTRQQVRTLLWRELGPNGKALTDLPAGMSEQQAAKLRTRTRALLTECVGAESPR
ncbi:MAG: hypothetical protein WA988_08245 [Candidatus Nanopelagicales bacterium]